MLAGDVFPLNSVIIKQAHRGFILYTKGTREAQEDGLDGVYVFENIEGLTEFLKAHFKVDEQLRRYGIG